MGQRLFQIIDDMVQQDAKDKTRLAAISNTFVALEKTKQGAVISMGADEEALQDIMSHKVFPILILVNKAEYGKRIGAES